jgi:hypothetical protein
MNQAMTNDRLARENAIYQGSGGVSAGNREHGFTPGFLDCETGAVYPSCGCDGMPAPVHLLDGLPDHLVEARSTGGRVLRIKCSIVSGFLCAGRFYTRAEAAALVDAACTTT